MNITTIDLLTPGECRYYAGGVHTLCNFWINRGGFYTLGAATYQDDPLAYPAIANMANKILAPVFGGLLGKVCDELSVLRGGPTVTLPGTGLPGFHIFNHHSNGRQGHPHIDEPYERIEWPQEYSDPFSFTLPLTLPACGGGLHVWPQYTDRELEVLYLEYVDDNTGEPEPGQVVEYEVGKLYIHDGLTPHRIGNFGDMSEGEYRITLQGHGVALQDGRIAVYF